MAGLLCGIEANDWRDLLAAAALMVVVAMSACLVPAWRATRIDPLRAIRYE